ncbi:hypothetical protein FJT64_027269 [Amphibalanus amphitrite]|uniref:PCNA-associated factor histone-like domain-containing protein n=1 Tax=Amphibalanus amphitrite TaxID=1232801 RepID=A0A6A4WDX6_AMPAM|nr:hypothetical protein FJT64_027269 [Amphibalanus amphitrite]
MVRTKADGIKGKERAGGGSGGGNSYHPQPIPSWQRPVAGFFTAVPRAASGAGGSSEGSSSGGSSEVVDQPVERSQSPEVVEEAACGSTDNFSNNGLISDDDE